jgi:hypothetical protein
MLNFIYTNSKLTSVTEEFSNEAINRNDITSLAHAEEIAQDATELTGNLHIGVDRGSSTSPRFDVVLKSPRRSTETTIQPVRSCKSLLP